MQALSQSAKQYKDTMTRPVKQYQEDFRLGNSRHHNPPQTTRNPHSQLPGFRGDRGEYFAVFKGGKMKICIGKVTALVLVFFLAISLAYSGIVCAANTGGDKEPISVEHLVEKRETSSQKNKHFLDESIQEKVSTNKPQPIISTDIDVSPKDVLPNLRKILSSSQGATVEAIHLSRRLSQEFDFFKNDIISAATDPSEQIVFRIQMLEVLNSHGDDNASRRAILKVFSEGNPSAMSTAYAAKYLSEQGVDIGGQIINNFNNTDIAARPIYLRAIGRLKRNDAVDLIREELVKSVDFDSRLAAIEALGSLADVDSSSSNLLMQIIKTRGQLVDGKRPARTLEIEAQRAVFSMADIGDANINSLLDVAADDKLATNIKIAAVESLKKHVSNKSIDIGNRLSEIEKEFSSSNASQSDKVRFSQMISIVINSIR